MIRALLLLMAVSVPVSAAGTSKLEQELEEIARVSTIMVDGDVCQRILTKRALAHILTSDPRDPYADGDNYDVDDASFNQVKKTLIRLSLLSASPVDVNLWMPLPAQPPRIHIVIRNRHEMSQFWEWGKLHQAMFPAMQDVLATGRRITMKDKPGFVSVLAPVHNSLGDVIGLVEVVSRLQPDARENVK